ncbi:MAG: HEAT repeat domain-containing protein [Terriglobales bacterium]
MTNNSPNSGKRLLVAILFVLASMARAYPGKRLQLQQLVADSDVIAIADLSNIRNVGTIETVVDGNTVKANVYKADALLLRSLKGSCPDRLILGFYTPREFVGYPGIGTGPQMVFLRQGQKGYVFADRHYPSLPAIANASPPPGAASLDDPLQRVVAELGSVIASTSAPTRDKWTVLARAYAVPKSAYFASALQLGLKEANDDDLKYRIQAELMSRDDLSQLSAAEKLLLTGALNVKQKELFLSVIANQIKNPDAAPMLARLLHSGDAETRKAAAEGLWNSADVRAVPDLVKALQDENEQVRFYAVRALAELNNEPRWGPSAVEFQEHQQQYLSHWQDWATTRPEK